MPDVATGKPRPPRAPVDREATNTKKPPASKARYPAAPDGQGPLLEWDQEPKALGIQAGLFVSLLVFGFLCLKDMGVTWMSNRALWLCVAAPIPIFWLYGRGKPFPAPHS